jgi:thioredoxin reductase (NADPH)
MADPASINFDFSAEQLRELEAYGRIERHAAGDVLVEEGTVNADLIITLSGHTDILVQGDGGQQRVGWMERGQFAGDLSVLTGQAGLARIVMGAEGEILRIAHADMLRLMAASADYSDIFVRTLSARRQFGHERGFAAVVLIGEAFDRSTHALRDLLTKHDLPHRWYRPDDGPVPGQMLEDKGLGADDLPVVILGGDGFLVSPGPEELATRLGLNLLPEGALADMVVVGCGPAGLAAAVYGASEGLSVIAIDSLAPGGQAGTSSKIENYLGFPTGISGRDLAQRAALQAQKFGARLVAPVNATALTPDHGAYAIALADGRSLRARSVVIATGAQYQRLDIAGLEEFEARGVYYGATPMEANLCGGAEVAVVGAGNSAGQGALHLAGIARR